MKSLRHTLLAVSLVMVVASSATAGFVDTAVTSKTGVLNTYHDTSFEAIYYNDQWGGAHGLQAGDVIVGFNQINQRTNPGSQFTTNTIYDVFSETIQSVAGGTTQSGGYVTGGIGLNLAPTNTGPESLQSIFAGVKDVNGNSINVPNNTIAMLFDRPQGSPFSTDLIGGPPASATSMADYLKYIAKNGTTELAAGFGKANDFLAVTLSAPPFFTGVITNDQGTASFFLNSAGQTFALYQGGLSVLQNNTGIVFGPVTLNGNTYDITATSGSAVTDGPGGGGDSNYGTWALGNNSTGAGFKDSLDLNADLISPEPSSIVIFGLGGLGFLVGAYRRKRKCTAAI